MALGNWNPGLAEGDLACRHERDERDDVETLEDLRCAADAAQWTAALYHDELRIRRNRDDYEHNLIYWQERSAKMYAKARALVEMYAAEVAS